MTNKETITRNIGLTFDFVSHLIDEPELIKDLPDKFKLNFVESDFSSTIKDVVEKDNHKLKEKFVRVLNSFEFPNN